MASQENKPSNLSLEQYLTATNHFFQKKRDLSFFIKTQITENMKPNSKGRRYSKDFKKIALRMFYSGGKSYKD